MTTAGDLKHGQVVIARFFGEPMRVETISSAGDGTWRVGLVGTQTEIFRSVTLSTADIAGLTIQVKAIVGANYPRSCPKRSRVLQLHRVLSLPYATWKGFPLRRRRVYWDSLLQPLRRVWRVPDWN